MSVGGATFVFCTRAGLGEDAAARVSRMFGLDEARELLRSQALPPGPGHDALDEVAGEEAGRAFRALLATPEGLERMWRADTVMALRSARSRGIVRGEDGKYRLMAWEYLDYLEGPPVSDVESLVNIIEGHLGPEVATGSLLEAAAERLIDGSDDQRLVREWAASPEGRGKLAALEQWCTVKRLPRRRRREEG